MLGRTANGVFWMARYLERAENTARLLDAGFRMAMTRDYLTSEAEWRSLIETVGMTHAYEAAHSSYTGVQVWNFMLRDKANPGNVLAMIEAARTNARAVRTALTREVWEAVNESWMLLKEAMARPVREASLGEVLSTVRRQMTLVRGAMEGSMLRNEIHNFTRLGTFIERGDSTARILDVKYYVLLPSLAWVGSSLDNVQWESVLRSVAGERSYRWLNAGSMDARGIADFLLLDQRFPRSLAFCIDKLRSNLRGLAHEYGHETSAHEKLRALGTRFHEATIESVFEGGLHEFIQEYIACNRRVALAIEQDYRFYA
ncbi:alpha-E domain-containing protein [Novosphingobium sp.]|uniref:alpha-E domain-containing protein n=1 Tax=Novosphingobium sp. TaxID=1874826 RepID=UPI001EC2510E|nr:alpha-E domain-containing protein [Novosphingobium sp.]MBK6800686.1 alpha-E domain-containing protein [Novosphingobium sp.]MBK9011245.1 alpha-E domain-containing protein [Novosphingobium sp.]